MFSLHSSAAIFHGLAAVFVSSLFFVDLLSDGSHVPFLFTEWLCWLLLLVAARLTQHSTRFTQNDDRNQSDKLALAFVAVCLCWTVGDARWAVPLCTPLCLLITALEEPRSKLPLAESAEKPNGFPKYPSFDTNLPVRAIIAGVIIAFVSAGLLFPFPALWVDVGTGLGFLFGLSTVYFVVYQRRLDSSAEDDSLAISLPAQSTTWRVVAILTMMIMIPSDQPIKLNIGLSILTAVFKAVQWVAVLEMIKRGFLLPMSTLATFANSFLQIIALPTTDSKCELVAGVALVSLAQTYRSISKYAYSRPAIFVAGFFLFLTLVFHRSDQVHVNWPSSLGSILGSEQLHPIEVLVKEANQEFAALLKSQSKTVDAAVAEYERRYKRLPPPAFEQWFELAKEWDSPIIDNFDTVMNALQPFWGITAQEMRARALMIDEKPLAVVTIKNGTSAVSKNSLVLGGFSEVITEWITNHLDILPDMEFVINGLAEPRVIVSNDRINRLISTCAPLVDGPLNGTRKELEIMDLGKETSWQIGTRSCPEDSPSRSIVIPETRTQCLPFISNATQAKDWCAHPNAAVSHGLFSSPYNLKITDTLVPIFSHGKPSSSQDLLYPSPDYLNNYRAGKYNASTDSPWSNKTNQLYWSGSDTGGFAHDEGWRHFHRQRFVGIVNNPDQDITLLSPPSSSSNTDENDNNDNSNNGWHPHPAKMANLSHLIDVKFSALAACAGATCKEESASLPVGDRDDPSVAFHHRFLFDVDGMGRTERYYHLLGSRSTILKQTMHQEWHDDRLVPWVHYVPVSLSMDELPEVLRFLALTENGQKISEEIADQGREWQQTALRGEDMELAFLRILLEYGRLVGEERDQSAYCPDGRVRPDT